MMTSVSIAKEKELGTMEVHPLGDVTGVRARGERIEITLVDGTGWSRVADMPDIQRDELADAIRAFVDRNRADPEPPPEALTELLERD